MNRRNVDELFGLLEGEGAPFDGCGSRELAEWLASRGVLVPSAISENEAWKIIYELDGLTYTSRECRATLSQRLERIAKGESV